MRRRALLAFCFLTIALLGGALMLVACGQDQARARVTPSPGHPTVPVPTATLPAPSPTRPATLPAATTTPSPAVQPPLPTPAPNTAVAYVEPAATATLPPSPLPPTASPSSTGPAAGPVPALSPVAPRLVKHGDRGRPWVALTFDACQTAASEAGYDAAIIETLIETETPATLFLGGLWMQSHPTQTQYLAGIPYFELGNHSWSHLDFQLISPEVMAAEITRTQEIMYQLTGRQPLLFRFPFGTWSPTALQVVAQHGLESIQWDLVTGDPDPNILAEDIVRVVSRQVQNGSIIIMHMNTRGWHTAEALPAIIQELSDRGFQFVTVSQMLETLPPETATPASPDLDGTGSERDLEVSRSETTRLSRPRPFRTGACAAIGYRRPA